MAVDYRIRVEDEYHAQLDMLTTQLPEVCRMYLLAKAQSYKVSTRVRYAEDLLTFLQYIKSAVDGAEEYEIKDLPRDIICSVEPGQIDEYMNYLERYEFEGKIFHNSNTSKKRKLATLRSFYKFLRARGCTKDNPAAVVDSPKLERKEIAILERPEQARLIATVSTGEGMDEKEKRRRDKMNLRDKAILYVLLGTGLRVSELVGMDLDDIVIDDNHPENNRIYVIRKGGKRDHIYMNVEVSEALLDYINHERPGIIPIERDEKAVFLSQKRQRITPRAINQLLKRYADGAALGESQIHAHVLRASFATNAVREHDLSSVAAALGHASSSTTSKYYTKATEDAKREVAATKLNIYPE